MKEQDTSPAVRTLSETRISARVVSRGIVIGEALCLYGRRRQYFRIDLQPHQIDAELERLDSAVGIAVSQLEGLMGSRTTGVSDVVSEILDVHLLFIRESSLIENFKQKVVLESVNAEWAVKLVSEEHLNRYRAIKDDHLREKAADFEDVVERILNALAGKESVRYLPDNSVIVASEIRPSTLLEFLNHRPLALVTEHGGWTSHVFIMARELGIPAVAGLRKVMRRIKTGDILGVDAIDGEVFVRPNESTRSELLAKLALIDKEDLGGTIPVGLVTTTDGIRISIAANVDKPDTCRRAIEKGANGIGLLRSEYLFDYINGSPSEESQTAAYRNVAEIAGIEGVTIRTFDLGIEQISARPDIREKNPALGLRAIRLSLAQEDQFRIQIRSILRSAHNKKVRMVFPLVSGVEDIKRSLAIVKDEWTDLEAKGIPSGQPQVGAMIELPSAVFSIKEILRYVDFVCLGTNDLVQYLMGVDRDNESVADWYQTLHPAVIRAVKTVLDAADNAKTPATVCGEMAGSPFYTPLLIGLGARDLSMNLHSIAAVRRLIGGIAKSDAQMLVQAVNTAETAIEIEEILLSFYRDKWSALFPTGLLTKSQSKYNDHDRKK